MENRNGKIVYSVSEINKQVSDYIKDNPVFSNVTIKGEISNCTYQQAKGHYYFSIKDDGALINCVFFKKYNMRMNYKLQNGMQIYATGWIDIYQETGKYQLYITSVEMVVDRGAIMAAYLQLKERLAEEGLFDFEHKKPIPKYPKAVGIVTSQDGAVVHDIIEEAATRNPYVQFYLYPVQVQGKGAPESVVRGIDYFERMGVDTIILGRGGGSSEELGAFDTELVARRVYNCTIPTISATGHAIHNTLVDYAADERAITPTQAGGKAVADIMTTLRHVAKTHESIEQKMSFKLRTYQMKLESLRAGIEGKHPARQIEDKKKKVELYYVNFTSLMQKKFFDRSSAFEQQSERMKVLMNNKYSSRLNRFNVALARMDGLSPTAKLRGGYGFIEKDSTPVTSVEDVKPGDNIKITIHDGTISATVDQS